jgi:hypothetical protein
MIIAAKYASTCPCCSARILPGSRIEWSKGSPARHLTCVAVAGPVGTVRAASPRRHYGRASGAGSAARVAGYSSWCTGREGCGCYDCAS